MFQSNATGLTVSSTDSGFISNSSLSTPSCNNIYVKYSALTTNNNLIIFLVMLGLASYLINRLPRVNRNAMLSESKEKVRSIKK